MLRAMCSGDSGSGQKVPAPVALVPSPHPGKKLPARPTLDQGVPGMSLSDGWWSSLGSLFYDSPPTYYSPPAIPPNQDKTRLLASRSELSGVLAARRSPMAA